MDDQPDVTHPDLRDELQEMMRVDQEWLAQAARGSQEH